MTYVHREHIDHPSAWTARSIGGKQGLVHRLEPRHNGGFYERAYRARNDMRPEFDEATKRVDALAQRDDIQLRFVLEPGEILLVNNYTVLHARTRFKDDPAAKRSLLRLWLTVPDGRPLGEAYRRKAVGYEPGTQASTDRPGSDPKKAGV